MDSHASALDVAAAIRSKEVSPVEVLDHYLARVDRLDPVLNAFGLRDDERARAEASAAADRVASASVEDLPPFHGVPIPIKDLYDVAGWPTSHGSKASSDRPAERDDLPVERLRRAGFVLMGKTTTPELGTISCDRVGPLRRHPQSVEPRSHARWQLGWGRGGGGVGHGAGRACVRRRGVHPHSVVLHRSGRPEAVPQPDHLAGREL